MPEFFIFAGLLLVTFVLAFKKGGYHDRVGACLFIFAAGASFFADYAVPHTINPPISPIAAIDAALLAALASLSLKSETYWPIWSTAFQLVTVFTHLAMLVQPDTVLRAYAVSIGLWSFPTVVSLLLSLIFRRSYKRTGLPV